METLFAILRRRRTVDRMQPFAIRIVQGNGPAHRLAPTVLVHQDAGPIQAQAYGGDRAVQLGQVVFPLDFMALGHRADEIAEFLGIIAGQRSAVAFQQVLANRVGAEPGILAGNDLAVTRGRVEDQPGVVFQGHVRPAALASLVRMPLNLDRSVGRFVDLGGIVLHGVFDTADPDGFSVGVKLLEHRHHRHLTGLIQ